MVRQKELAEKKDMGRMGTAVFLRHPLSATEKLSSEKRLASLKAAVSNKNIKFWRNVNA